MNYTVVPILLSGSNLATGETSKNLIPVELSYDLTDNLKVKNTSLVFNDGFRFYTNKFLENLKDVSYTKNVGYYLTDLKTWDEFVYDGYNTAVNSLNNDTKVLFDRLQNTGFFYAYLRDVTGENPYATLYVNDDLEIGVDPVEKTLVKFVKTTSNKVKIYFYETYSTQYSRTNKTAKQYLLSVDTSSYDHTLKLVPISSNFNNFIYEFNLTLVEDLIKISYDVSSTSNYSASVLQTVSNEILSEGSNTTRYIGLKNGVLVTNHVFRGLTSELTNINKYANNTRVLNIFNASRFALQNPGYRALTLGIPDTKQNTWVHYYNEIYDKENNQNVKPNSTHTVSEVPINYLLTSKFKITTRQADKLPVNIVPLKTVYTPEQETLKTSTIFLDNVRVTNAASNLQPIQRTYTKLFTNNNEIENYPNLHLGYNSSTKEFIFKADENTFFHYPLQADRISISNANLIESGAIPGATPHLSDKIFVKNANYGDKSYWGHASPLPGCPNGQFLCAWLSGSDASSLSGLENSVWMDRWYDSAIISHVSALEIDSKLTTDLQAATIVDVPSEMVLNPGGWYYYYHVGNNNLAEFVDSFNIGNTGLRLRAEGSFNTFSDTSDYENIVSIVNQKSDTIIVGNPDEKLEDNYVLNLDGTNYATIQHDSTLDLAGDVTVAAWINSDKWEDNPGYHVIDNGFRGGWNMHLVKDFFNPTVVVTESNYGHGLSFSTELRPYTDNVLLTGTSINTDNVIVTNDLYTFVFDKTSKALSKFDYNGDMVDLLDVSSYTGEVSNSKLDIGSNNLIYLHFNDQFIKTDTSFTSITASTLNFTNFAVDLSGKVIGGNFIDAAVDNYNNLWYISACPANFFTDYIQPDLNSAFFQSADNVDYLNRTMTDALSSNGDLNFIFHTDASSTTPMACAAPISVVDLNNNGITFNTFFPNNASNAVLAKFFQPTRLDIDHENYLYVTNDTHELMKFIIDKNNELAGFLYRKPLLSDDTTTGLSLSGVTSYIQTNLIDVHNDFYRDYPQFKYMEVKTTEKQWKDEQSKYDRTKINNLCLNREYDYINNEFRTVLYYISNKTQKLYKLDPEGQYLGSVPLFDAYDINEGPTINNSLTIYNTVATTYDQYRKYIRPTIVASKTEIELEIYTLYNGVVTKSLLRTGSRTLLNKEWHHMAFTYKQSTGKITLYLDGVITDTVTVTANSQIYYRHRNNIGVGVSVLKYNTLQDDFKSDAYLFRGRVDDIRIYDHVLTPGNIGRLILNKYKIHDLVWNFPASTKNYIEEIKQYFKHKTPGRKSALFDIYLNNSGIEDTDVRIEIEKIIRDAMPRVVPSHVRLNKIIWT